MNDLDILICIVPKVYPDAPTVGPAILKSHLMADGFTCEVIDLNIRLFNALKEKGTNEHYYFEDDELFIAKYDFVDLNDRFKVFCIEHEHILMEWIELFRKKNPRWIGFSLLSPFSMAMAIKLSSLVREHLPHIKIVWGGPQVGVTHYSVGLTKIGNGIESFKDRGILDHYISGDAEFSLSELLRGNLSAKGIDSLKTNQIDLNHTLIPNYDDIVWSDYYQIDDLDDVVYITGSRGCVKKCTFCNVPQIWPEYRFRSSNKLVNEIIAIKHRYGRKNFKFTDSLINGSMKTFRDMMHELKEYRKIDSDFHWLSQWIIRPKNQSPEEDFKLMKESGCLLLEIGVESFSQDVRYHMGKKFTDEDLWWCLEMLQKYEIEHFLLMIIGYPTETEKDHQFTLDTINKLFDLGYASKKNNRNGDELMHIWFGNLLQLSTDLPLWQQIKDDLTYYEDEIRWEYQDNNASARYRRFKEVHELIEARGGKSSSKWIKRMTKMAEAAESEYLRKKDK